ncbi:hypothetical protein [uncultured Methylobacterium sp.]|uniref:hypothetical protein n=1 Tax=uncultured Methylobacterium sp. TaxID=157278 RepID=UPI0035CAC470
MSEYQYYDFLAVDRPLGEADRQALRALSTRARITATRFTNHYEWGNFKGDPAKLVRTWFDLHLYAANWGTRRLMLRLPRRLVDKRRLDAMLRPVEDATLTVSGDDLILDIVREAEDDAFGGWTEADDEGGDDTLGTLVPLRADVLAGDLRLFYLLWLIAVEAGTLPPDTPEPLPGLGPLNGPLAALAAFLRLDSDLVAAAAERTGAAPGDPPSAEAARAVIAAMPERDRIAMLVRVSAGDPHAAAEVRARVLAAAGPAEAPAAPRTAGDLLSRAQAQRLARQRREAERAEAEGRRQAQAAETARRVRIDATRRRGEGAWRAVESEAGRRNASGYDRAAALLADLRVIAEEGGTLADFSQRLADIRARHARKDRFLERLGGLG